MKNLKAELFKSLSLAVIVTSAATFAACSGDEDILNERTNNQTEKQGYTMTVQATKSDAQTRGLILDGQNLNVKWNEGEEVYVVQQEDNDPYGYNVLGKLTATPDTEDQTMATLTGTLTTAPTHQRDIVFYLHSANSDYRGQKGVLLKPATGTDYSIETNYDYAMAIARWDVSGEFSVDEQNKTVSVPDGLSFQGTQAIVKFILKDKEGNAIKAKSLTIRGLRFSTVDNICLYHPYNSSNDEEGPLTITPAAPTSEIYAAIRTMEIYPMLFTLTVIDENDVRYTYEKTDVQFYKGKFYSITVKMKDTKVNLSTLTENYVAKDGDILMGELKKNIKVSIADGANVTLRDLSIEGVEGEYGDKYPWAGITCEGNATIVLEGNNTAKGFDDVYPGIYVPKGKTLTITGDGSLTASSNGYGAGIGAGNNMACGDIVIEGGTITATGGSGCAGIGAAGSGNCGNITIKGGTVEATGGQASPGIGAGDQAQCGNITIENTVDMVTATAGDMANYSIGVSAAGGTCGTITIGGTQYYDGTDYTSEELKASPFIYKPIKMLSAATTADLGKVVCAQGHLHDAKTAVPEGCTAVGILGKVTEKGKGLILALKDATSQSWNTINGWTSVTTYAGTTLKILPDNAARGSLTSYTSLGGITVSNWAVAQQDDYEAIFTNLGSQAGDEAAGITFDANVNAYMTTRVGGEGLDTGNNGYWTATEAKKSSDRACYFSSECWGSSAKYYEKWVRPVLGF